MFLISNVIRGVISAIKPRRRKRGWKYCYEVFGENEAGKISVACMALQPFAMQSLRPTNYRIAVHEYRVVSAEWLVGPANEPAEA